MNIYKTKTFNKWSEKERIKDSTLLDKAYKLSKGVYYAKYNDELFKLRKGKERYLVCFKNTERTIYLSGFLKGKQENISKEVERELKKLASFLLNLPQEAINTLVDKGELIEIRKDS